MLRWMAKAKVHGLTITQAELYYAGSLTLDSDLMAAADLLPEECVQIVNLANGERLETYLIPGEGGSGIVCLNGPAARLGAVGDKIHVISYAMLDELEARQSQMVVVRVDDLNRPVKVKRGEQAGDGT